MAKRKKFTIDRMSPEDLNQFAEEVFNNNWVCFSPEGVKEEPWAVFHLDLFLSKYEIQNPEGIFPWFENKTGPRGYLMGSMKLVHIDDHNEIIKRLNEARKVVVEGVKSG